MSTDLTPDVRAEAAGWAERAYLDRSLWKDRHIKRDWPAVVDAVTAVVAPEIARPLQARIEELKAAVKLLEAQEDHLRDQAGEMAEELTFLRGEAALIEQDEDRVGLLTVALTDAAEGLDRILLPSALHTNWHELKSYSTRARAALAAGKTESEEKS